MLTVFVISLSLWWQSRDLIPDKITLAAGIKGGQYYELANYLKSHLAERTGSAVKVLETVGSQNNTELLLSGEADFAILQLGPSGIQDLPLLTPLFAEHVYIIARKQTGIHQLTDLSGQHVVLNALGSGMLASAKQLIRHYSGDLNAIQISYEHFSALAINEELDAAIITSGVMNPGLEKLLLSGEFQLLSIPEAEGLALRQPFFSAYTIPQGVYRGGNPAIPAQPVKTISTIAVLAARKNISPNMVEAMLDALYLSDAFFKFPGVYNKGEAKAWDVLPKHQYSAAYFNPYEGIDLLASFMESMAAGKELLFAIGAAFYMIWERNRRKKEIALLKALKQQKERLDYFLDKTIVIERQQLHEKNPQHLYQYLEEVTKIKLEALEELTDEDLRADRAFSIFLMQCANLTLKIQNRIHHLSQH